MKIAIPLLPPQDTKNGAPSFGFTAHTLYVDNPTPAYWYLPDELRYVPPYTTGIVIPLEGVNAANIYYQAPPTIQQSTISGIQLAPAMFTYSDREAGFDSGVNLAGSSFGRNVVPIPFTAPSSGLTVVLPQPAPDGIIISVQNGQGNNLQITVQPYGDPVGFTLFAGFVGWGVGVNHNSMDAYITYKKRLGAQTQINLLPAGVSMSGVILI